MKTNIFLFSILISVFEEHSGGMFQLKNTVRIGFGLDNLASMFDNTTLSSPHLLHVGSRDPAQLDGVAGVDLDVGPVVEGDGRDHLPAVVFVLSKRFGGVGEQVTERYIW